jgi:hypothetical protein
MGKNMKNIKITLLILVLLSLQVYAGTSIFGVAPNSLGSINMNNSVAGIGRGGFETAYFDTLSLNNVNFAQWPFLTQTTINLNVGYNRLSTETNSQSIVSYSGNFDGGFLAIPVVVKKLAFGISLSPSIVNDQSVTLNNIGVGADVNETLKSTGNISEGNFVGAYAINNNISVAGVVSYNFGLIEDNITLDYDAEGYTDLQLFNKYRIHGSSFALHSFFKLNEQISSGFRIKFPTKLTMKTEQNSINSIEYVNESREIDLPLNMSYGMAYLFENQYIAGLDVNYQLWKDGYKINGVKQEGFENSYRIALGLEKMPSSRRFVPYHQRMYYRGGIHLGQLNIQSDKKSVLEYGVSVGVGLPILSPRDRVDFALQYRRRGDLSTNQAVENIFSFHVSITAGSLWFVREDN